MANNKSFDDFYQEAVQAAGAGGAPATKAAAADFDFCSIWPVAKTALEFLKTLLPLWAKLVIDAAIKYGDNYCSGK